MNNFVELTIHADRHRDFFLEELINELDVNERSHLRTHRLRTRFLCGVLCRHQRIAKHKDILPAVILDEVLESVLRR